MTSKKTSKKIDDTEDAKKKSSTQATTAKDKPITSKKKEVKKEEKQGTVEMVEPSGATRMVVLLLLAIIVVIAGYIGYTMWASLGADDTKKDTEVEVFVDINGDEVEKDSPAAIIPRRIDGMMVARADANKVPTCVMIENAAFGGVRPQSGLNSASVVYEVIVEGGITRFMAVFAGEQSDTVGPIRSARDTYLEFASEYDCMYTHAGGSYTAMQAIPRFGMRDLDALRESQWFWRDGSKYAPHNLFSSTAKLQEALESHSWHKEDAPSYDSWNFVEAIGAPEAEAAVVEAVETTASAEGAETVEVVAENGTVAVNTIRILFGGSYNAQYDYNAEGNYYERTNGGILQIDEATGETLRTNNVVVMNVGAGIPIEGKGRVNWPVTGEGEVQVYHDGRVYEGTWKKPSREGRLQFYDADGELLPLVRGNTWIDVVPEHITVETE